MFWVSSPGGSLAELIARQEKEGAERLSEDDLKQVLLQVAQGLRYIHSQHLVHLDIKPGQWDRICTSYFDYLCTIVMLW